MSNNADDIDHIVAPYLTFEQIIINPLSTLSAMFVVYGIYVVVFGLSIYILSHRDGPSPRLYMRWSISLFVLSTLCAGIETWGLCRQAVIDFKAAMTKNYTPFLEYATGDEGEIAWLSSLNLMNCIIKYVYPDTRFLPCCPKPLKSLIADSMLVSSVKHKIVNAQYYIYQVHRCCVIWQSRIMTYLLAFLAAVLNGINLGISIVGTVGLSISNLPLYAKSSIIDSGITIALAIFQVLLALLTGGRIWWISQQPRRLMGQSTNDRYNSIVAIIIESGVFYAACLVAGAASGLAIDSNIQGLVPFDFGPVQTLMSGLAPTLIIVRVAYRKSVDSVQQMVSLHLADSVQPTTNLHLQMQISGHVHSQLNELSPMPATGGLGDGVMND